MDPETYRAESRDAWERAAPGWERRAEVFAAMTAPVTDWLVGAVRAQAGQTLLELAAGPGDVGLRLAGIVGDDGRVLVTDGAEGMVAAARARADRTGAANVETRAMEAEWIDLPAASVDGVVCRWGYMLLADPEAALRETRRVLRPGGRVALAAWATAEENPWLGLVGRVLAERGLAPAPDPAAPGPFAFAPDGLIADLLATAGFAEVETGAVAFEMRGPSLDAWWEQHRAQSPSLAAATAGLSPKGHYELRDAFDAAFTPFVQPDGSVVVPARALVAAATA